MSACSHPSDGRPSPRPLTGLALTIALALASIALAIGLLISASFLKLSPAQAQMAESRIQDAGLPRLTAPSGIPGFQRRGNSLVGDVRAADGAMLRLVFDARTHALIGMKVIETSPVAATLPGRDECIAQAGGAPRPSISR